MGEAGVGGKGPTKETQGNGFEQTERPKPPGLSTGLNAHFGN